MACGAKLIDSSTRYSNWALADFLAGKLWTHFPQIYFGRESGDRHLKRMAKVKPCDCYLRTFPNFL